MRSFIISLGWLGTALAACGPAAGVDPSGHGALLSIEVQPANAALEWTGTPATLDYTAVGHYEDGTVGALPAAVFSLDEPGARLGSLAAAKFSASGVAAGKGGVTATFDDQSGATSVIVTVHTTTLGDGVDPGAAGQFGNASPAGPLSQAIVYPLDQAVVPTSAKPPDVQWEGALTGADDLYRVRLVAGGATEDTILSAPAGSHFAPPAAGWQTLVNSLEGGSLTLTVDHWDATTGAQGGAPVRLKLVSAQVTGAIYYWHLDAGRMERIDEMGRAPAIPAPPANPGDGNHCVACHSVSRDGRYLAGSMWGGGLEGAVFDMSSDAVRTGNPAPTVAPLVANSTYRQLFTTFNPDATRLMINEGLSLRVVDPQNPVSIATTGTPLPQTGAAHPSWSPDGSAVAFIDNVTLGGAVAPWAVDYDRGDLSIIPVTGPDAFGPAAPIVPAAGAAFAAPSWPTWTPDSNYIAYGAGTNSRGSANASSGRTEYPGSLFLVGRAGGTVQRLDRACKGLPRCYLPNFGPFDAGGYYWLIYYSFQDYGNASVGTKGTNRRQMWITAIDKSKLGTGEDPSSVPYWVPDQDSTSQNMSAFWALPAPIQ